MYILEIQIAPEGGFLYIFGIMEGKDVKFNLFLHCIHDNHFAEAAICIGKQFSIGSRLTAGGGGSLPIQIVIVIN